MTNRIDMETAATVALGTLVKRQLGLPKNRRKGVPLEDAPTLVRLAMDECDEALHAWRSGAGRDAFLSELGDAGAFLAMAAWRAMRGNQ